MPKAGQKPGRGHYYCKQCGEMQWIDNGKQILQECRRCNGTDFYWPNETSKITNNTDQKLPE